uniref:carboxymuconolactone decarboxylase family protein n=1 Tax=Nocardia suismassiliense TaxID=2077092 RepID=UPI003F491173
MSSDLVQTALRRSLKEIRYVTPADSRTAASLVAEVYSQMERDFGMLAPPIALHSPAPDILAATWMILRESLVATGRVARVSKEIIAEAVSRTNQCPYCAAVHGANAAGGGDAQASAVAAWVTANSRGGAVVVAPFSVDQTPEAVGVAVTFQFLNRMVNIFLGDSPLPPALPARLHPVAMRGLARFMRGTAARGHAPGESLGLLPAVPSRDLTWTATNPVLAEAFDRAITVIETAGRRSVPTDVRDLVEAQTQQWRGQPQGFSRAWLETLVSPLPSSRRPAARLAVLTAFASYRVDADIIEGFRLNQPGDRELIELTAWASMTAALRTAEWMTPTITDSSGQRSSSEN